MRNEHERVDDQVEQEPVEPEKRALRELVVDRHARPAEQRRDQRRRHADRAERLVATQRQADHAEHEGRDQHQMQQRANVRHRVQRPRFGRREELRKVKTEDGAQPDQPEAADRTPLSQPEPNLVGSIVRSLNSIFARPLKPEFRGRP